MLIAASLGICGLASHHRGDLMRRRIVELVAREPGIHMARAARILGIGANTLDFHVRKLQGDTIMTYCEGKTVHMFPPSVPPAVQPWLAMCADPEVKLIAAIISQAGEVGIERVSQIRGISRKVVRKHMLRMVDAGLLERAPGRHGGFSPTSALVALEQGAPAWGESGGGAGAGLEGKRPSFPHEP